MRLLFNSAKFLSSSARFASNRSKVFFDVSIGDQPAGKITIEVGKFY